MSLFVRHVFLLLWLRLLSTSNGFEIRTHKSHVSVTNSLEGGVDLALHCKSADDDLGVQILSPNSSFVWSFTVNFFSSTLFHCAFQWNDVIHKFAIYEASRDELRCLTCDWTIKEDGPCLFLYDHLNSCYPWKD
ncbi:hypothetical protein PHAVU_008G062800 [Phaseolus vulgaris]|uniref:S-protein homolog n=1 Tax=Phaseolus vulgaris TaxID=3885 RepID=V7B2P0_PHAVU|nr:hypothetical protein PHAVU_008G062800g [Phaseolus vulgaris]ESW11840.1 hypothetical protein PHAVU_008G062800g [Phaseolus vulgaris]